MIKTVSETVDLAENILKVKSTISQQDITKYQSGYMFTGIYQIRLGPRRAQNSTTHDSVRINVKQISTENFFSSSILIITAIFVQAGTHGEIVCLQMP